MGIIGNKKADQEAKKHAVVSPNKFLIVREDLFEERKIMHGRKNGEVKAP